MIPAALRGFFTATSQHAEPKFVVGGWVEGGGEITGTFYVVFATAGLIRRPSAGFGH